MQRRPIALASIVVGTSVLAACSASATPTTLTARGNGVSSLRLGAREATAVATLTRELGRPSARLTATPALTSCGVSATIGWSSMDAYFNRHRLVGISFGPGHSPSVRTTAGLRLGDTLGRARALYGKKLTTSPNQGGAWFVSTSAGRLSGFLNPSTSKIPTSSAKIWTIDVGVVGCPAESP